VRALGALSIVAGLGLAVAAGARLGRSLTPLPVPVTEGALVREGVYRHARHPIYGGVLLASVGWTVATGSWASLAATAALWMTFEAKSRFEERWLARRYPGYEAYARGTRRFLPFLY
jgi:protein-S-isoprenylcysteine O-methyltransferase Ste14